MTVTLNRRSMALLTFTLCLLFSALTQAALEVSENAYELTTEQILRWPLRAGDNIVIQPCAGCAIQTLQVTEQTRYAIGFGPDATSIKLNELLRQKSLLRDNANNLIILFFHPDDRRVSRIVLNTEI